MMMKSLLCNAICPVEWSLFTVSYKWQPCNYECSLFSLFIFRLAFVLCILPPPNSEIFVSQRIRKLPFNQLSNIVKSVCSLDEN